MQQSAIHNAMSITIHEASVDNVEILQRVGRQTFLETFADRNTEADMQRYLQESFSGEQLRAELAHPYSRFYMAWDGENPIGYLKVNFGEAQTELQDDDAVEIQRIYVLCAYQGRKVGQMLYEKALEIAQAAKKSYLWLGVWEENFKALRFYQKHGFAPFDTHLFILGDSEQLDILMRKSLK